MNTLNKTWLSIRAALFWVGFSLSTLLAGFVIPLLWLLPRGWHYQILLTWNRFNLWWLTVTCGVKYRVQGRENIPTAADGPFIVMSNHQSTWETLALACIFPQELSWVLKRELLKVPIFGWGLHFLKPIAIDRGSGRVAVKQIVDQGSALLAEGRSIVIFPEGTRVAPGKKMRYKIGGAVFAARAKAPIIPVAHNAGECWRRHAWIKYPGTITVSIGPPITTVGLKGDAINGLVENWIETEKQQLPPART